MFLFLLLLMVMLVLLMVVLLLLVKFAFAASWCFYGDVSGTRCALRKSELRGLVMTMPTIYLEYI